PQPPLSAPRTTPAHPSTAARTPPPTGSSRDAPHPLLGGLYDFQHASRRPTPDFRTPEYGGFLTAGRVQTSRYAARGGFDVSRRSAVLYQRRQPSCQTMRAIACSSRRRQASITSGRTSSRLPPDRCGRVFMMWFTWHSSM